MAPPNGSYLLGLGVWLTLENGEPVRIELRDLRALVRALGCRGDQIMHGFLVGLSADERFAALVHLSTMNGNANPPLPLLQRNQHVLTMGMFATFHEAMDAIDILDRAGLSGLIGKDFPAWSRLRAMRTTWLQNDTFTQTLRNAFGGHLGVAEIKRGLATAPDTENYVIYDHSQGQERVYGRHPMVLRLQLLGLRDKDGKDLDTERLNASGFKATEDATAFGLLLEETIWQTLRRAGVKAPTFP